jgi:hypothetical protein
LSLDHVPWFPISFGEFWNFRFFDPILASHGPFQGHFSPFGGSNGPVSPDWWDLGPCGFCGYLRLPKVHILSLDHVPWFPISFGEFWNFRFLTLFWPHMGHFKAILAQTGLFERGFHQVHPYRCATGTRNPFYWLGHPPKWGGGSPYPGSTTHWFLGNSKLSFACLLACLLACLKFLLLVASDFFSVRPTGWEAGSGQPHLRPLF